jgi:tetratricopeptide (TPR) repeat protein
LLDQKRQAENTFKLAVGSAEKFSRKILETFNSGQLKTSGAIELQKITADIYRTYGEVRDTPETSILRTAWLLTDSDLEDALGDKKEVRANVGKAENDARKYLDLDPGNRRWQELLYGSLFRSGDLDLEQYINEHNPKLFDQALAEYEEGRLIADKIAATEPKTEMANVDDTAAQKFDLAFIINKVGEATQVRGDIEGALKRYNEALDLAVLIEGATRMDCKLQSATTRIKIANALLARTPADIDGALRNYSEAIEREEGIFAEDKSNNIVRSNLAGAYDGRAQAFEKHGQFDLAFKGYADAASMFSRLVDEDVRDTKWLERLARVDRKLGDALESYARSRNEPLDKAIEQYKSEVAVRGRLAERDPSNTAWRNSLRESQERLQRLQASNAVTPGKSSAAE